VRWILIIVGVPFGVFCLFVFLNWLTKKTNKWTREEVATAIEDFVEGRGKPWDWDDFTSCPIADEELERARIQCLRVQQDYPTGAIGWCNEEGIEVLRKLARDLRSEKAS